jgi:hypothetical protein
MDNQEVSIEAILKGMRETIGTQAQRIAVLEAILANKEEAK